MENTTIYQRSLRIALLVAVVILAGAGKAASNSEYTYQKITGLGTPCTPAPPVSRTDSTIFFQFDFEPWGINNRGDLAFAADFTNRGDLPCGPLLPSDGEGVFVWHNGQLSQITRSDLAAPGGGTFAAGVLAYVPINERGDVAITFGLDPFVPAVLEGFAKAGLYRYSHTSQTLNAVVTPFVTSGPGIGTFQSTGLHASLNNSGDIAFSGVVNTNAGTSPHLGQGIFVVDEHDKFSKVVVPGDPAPGGGFFDYSVNPWINDGGDVAFSAHVKSDECIQLNLFGPACAESIYLEKRSTGRIQSIAHQGDPAPGGGRYRFAWGAQMNNRGDIVYMGDLSSPPDIFAITGIFVHSGDNTIAVARPGDNMPAGGAIVTVNPAPSNGNYSINNRGDISFIAALDNGGGGLYVREHLNGSFSVVARTGMTIPGVGTIADLTHAGSGVNGGALNDSGQVFFWATLTDGSGVMLVATPRP